MRSSSTWSVYFYANNTFAKPYFLKKNYFFNLNSLTATTSHKWPTPISNHVVNNCSFFSVKYCHSKTLSYIILVWAKKKLYILLIFPFDNHLSWATTLSYTRGGQKWTLLLCTCLSVLGSKIFCFLQFNISGSIMQTQPL